jgi:hypothetical protein
MRNNSAERAIRPIALGGNNLFAGSDAGGRCAAIVSTLVETANSTMSQESSTVPRARRRTTIAAAGSLYLVLFAPASSEQAFCSLGCDVSQVVIDCVSEAAIFLFMQEQ